MSRSSDPYVVGRYTPPGCTSDQKQQTEIVKKDLNPVWNKEFMFDICFKDRGEAISLEVFDYDRNSQDDTMGRLSLPLASILPSEKEQFNLLDWECNNGEGQWFNLSNNGEGQWFNLGDVKKGELLLQYTISRTRRFRQEFNVALSSVNPEARVVQTSSHFVDKDPADGATPWLANLLRAEADRQGPNPGSFHFADADPKQFILLDLRSQSGSATLVDQIGAEFSTSVREVWDRFRVYVSRDGENWFFWGESTANPSLPECISIAATHTPSALFTSISDATPSAWATLEALCIASMCTATA
eukprot:CAMPEP_0175935368 /NCGR_PEP_ID=MMETSP0108-20121206/20995_1 /TAXON_ID=195067 ORGANISM="Goniomonas pacifica, Strain CCMP1869" /NCGR_SAMPLE_ID=MMETSP0108 /ASSEMBLY_ACC=CAM_ASM_000204 /LENGTH=300 /DNA_ID=CAMNT_0017259287 /DNA_START=28 /DNA_END=927 /DNA_ORIENTATION=+